MTETISPSNYFQSRCTHQINNSSLPTIQSTWDTDIFGALSSPIIFSCWFFPLLLVFLSQVRLVSQATTPWGIPTQLSPWFFILVFFYLSKRTKKTKNKNPTTQNPNKTKHAKPQIQQTNKQQKNPLKTKLLFLFKFRITLQRMDCNTGSVCYCRIICKDYPAEQKLHRIPKRLSYWSRIRKEK